MFDLKYYATLRNVVDYYKYHMEEGQSMYSKRNLTHKDLEESRWNCMIIDMVDIDLYNDYMDSMYPELVYAIYKNHYYNKKY